MAIPNYADLITFKLYLGVDKPYNDALATMALSAAARAVDRHCQRRFWLDPAPVTRTFTPKQGLLYLDLWDGAPGSDIGLAAGLQLACDTSGDGTFETVWSASDLQLLPVDAPYRSPEPEPWTALRAVGTRTFPWLVNTWLTHLNRVQVTARWGWPEVPAGVIQATMIKAARLYHRKDSPQGIAGFGEMGPVRLSTKEDADVISLLHGYIKEQVLVR